MHCIVAAFLAAMAATAHAQAAKAPTSTLDLVNASKSCFSQKSGTIECHYKAGKTLEITIVGVGEADGSIIFVQSNEKGDFYAKFQLALGCILVKPGDGNKVNHFLDFAFISPTNGKAYSTGMECESAR